MTLTPCQLLILLLEESIRYYTVPGTFIDNLTPVLSTAGCYCFFIPIPEIPAFDTGWK